MGVTLAVLMHQACSAGVMYEHHPVVMPGTLLLPVYTCQIPMSIVAASVDREGRVLFETGRYCALAKIHEPVIYAQHSAEAMTVFTLVRLSQAVLSSLAVWFSLVMGQLRYTCPAMPALVRGYMVLHRWAVSTALEASA